MRHTHALSSRRFTTWRRARADHPSGTARHAARDERGSTLILAFVYLVAVGITVTALTGWAANNLNNTGRLSTVRSLQEAARSTTEVALQSIRYTPLLQPSQTLNASPPNYCWGPGPTSGVSNIDGYSVNSWCSTVWNPTSAVTRVVTISTCLSTVSAAACANAPYLKVVVNYDDYPPGGAAPVSGSCELWTWCGEGQTIVSWVWLRSS
jgi:hypothetical protein